jgi:hypothetical protein
MSWQFDSGDSPQSPAIAISDNTALFNSAYPTDGSTMLQQWQIPAYPDVLPNLTVGVPQSDTIAVESQSSQTPNVEIPGTASAPINPTTERLTTLASFRELYTAPIVGLDDLITGKFSRILPDVEAPFKDKLNAITHLL